jgi:DUF1680 family protein
MRIVLIIGALTVLALGVRSEVKPAVSFKAQAFPLSNVRLLDGPFKRAMDLDARYLLSLEPDRLLSWFRKEAGLRPKAVNYAGWESQGIAGHTLGHYLSACSLMYASTDDRRFLDRVNYIVDELAACQRANGNGYLAAIPNGKKAFIEIARGDIRTQGFDLNGIWVPWYTLHKEFAGLIDAFELCGNLKSLTVATNLANWAKETTKNLTDEQWQRMLICEHGGMNEVLAELYSITGDATYLALAKKFYHKAILESLAQGKDELDGKHSNMQIPKVIGLARLHELTGSEHDANTARFFWERVALHRSFAFGGHGDHEHFFPINEFAKHLSTDSAETCCTYNLLRLTRHLFEWSPDAEEMDFYERALFNHILASQDPVQGMFVYLMPTKPGHFKTYSTPEDSFWCCVGTGMENHAKYGDTIYFQNDESLFVNLFIPSELTWREKGLVVRQETEFPENDTSILRFKADKPITLAVKIRRPAWATGAMTVAINGQAQPIDSKPGSYVTLQREWANNDKVEIRLPMSLYTEPLPGTSNIVALLYGPLVLAGELGTNGIPTAYARGQTDYSALSAPSAPVLVCDAKSLLTNLFLVPDHALTFRTRGIGRPNDVSLIPLHRLDHQRYSVYWTLFSQPEWETRRAELAAAEQNRIALEARTVDVVRPGEQQSEVDHQVRGEKSDPIEALGRKLRHAVDGGWFSYDLKVDGGHANELVCTWWGDESGERAFEILVNGTRIASEKLLHNRPGIFWDAIYPIPTELTRGKEKITVKFQAKPGNFAGGIFGCRLLRTSGGDSGI